MATPPGRVAFQRCLVHEHRNPNSAISALALDATGTKLYLGFTDGQLEEYKITADFAHAKALLSARKHVGKKVCHMCVGSYMCVCSHMCAMFCICCVYGGV